jgi:hypothetical protein
MALHPIDLQTLYTQLENVSKGVAFQQHGLQLREAVQQENYGKQLTEKEKAVKEAAQEQSETVRVKDQNKRNQNAESSAQKEKKQNDEEQDIVTEPKTVDIKDPRLGTLIDIQG